MTFTWEERIENAKRMGKFTEPDRDCSQSWKCCAVGEVCFTQMSEEDKETYRDGFPRDDEVYTLGMQFATAVDNDEVPEAEDLYRCINETLEMGVDPSYRNMGDV